MKKNLIKKIGVNNIKEIIILSELLVLSLIICSSIAMADIGSLGLNNVSEPVHASVYPEFIKYKINTISTQTENSLYGQQKSLKPILFIPIFNDICSFSSFSSTDTTTPAYYDLRALNKTTSVKYQGDAGVCWAFATYGSLESCLMPEENWDFSENNMKNILSSAYPEGFDRNPDDNGSILMSIAYLARWSGPVAENEDVYDPNSTVSPQNLTVKKHVQNVLFISSRREPLDNAEIKSGIQKYGAVFTSMYYSPTYYSPTNCSYYYNGLLDSVDAVDIVGWNDSYDRNKFSVIPPGNGAFIVKNSFNWGNGYIYVSYYDSNIGTYNAVVMAEDPDNYKYIYQYDPLGFTNSIGFGNPSGWCANVFTAKSDEILKAVSFYTTNSSSKYEYYIYTPDPNPNNNFGSVFSKRGTIQFGGYHTIPLDYGIPLKAGQQFSIVLKLTTPGDICPIAIENPIANHSSKAKSNPGESFISPDGKKWKDITTYYPNANVCIKAFTIPWSSHLSANSSEIKT